MSGEGKEPLMVVKMETPLVFGSETFTELRFMRRACVRDLYDTGSPTMDQKGQALLLSRLTNVPLPAIEQMDAYDYLNAVEVVAGFLQVGPKAGKKL